jgi:hypothetical protein
VSVTLQGLPHNRPVRFFFERGLEAMDAHVEEDGWAGEVVVRLADALGG